MQTQLFPQKMSFAFKVSAKLLMDKSDLHPPFMTRRRPTVKRHLYLGGPSRLNSNLAMLD
jgi:hypothetical protein